MDTMQRQHPSAFADLTVNSREHEDLFPVGVGPASCVPN